MKWYKKGIRVFEWGFDVSIFQAKVREVVSIIETLRNYKINPSLVRAR